MDLFGRFFDKFFDHMYVNMLSKFIKKSAQKSHIFPIKASFERGLISSATKIWTKSAN